MDSDTYRPFDPWRPTPVKEESRKQIVETHYFNVDRVAFSSASSNGSSCMRTTGTPSASLR